MTNTILVTESIRYWSFMDVRHKGIRRRRRETVVQLQTLCSVGAIRWWESASSPGSFTRTKNAVQFVHGTGDRVGPRASLDGHAKSLLHRDSIPCPSSPWRVPITTTLSWPDTKTHFLRSRDIPKANVTQVTFRITPSTALDIHSLPCSEQISRKIKHLCSFRLHCETWLASPMLKARTKCSNHHNIRHIT